MPYNTSSTIVDRYQQYHQVMASHTALSVLQTSENGVNSPPIETDTTWHGDTISPPHPRSLPSDSSDHLVTPTTTPFAFDPVSKPYQRVNTDQSMFAPTPVYQQTNWQTPQYSEETLNQSPKSLPTPSPSSNPTWPAGMNMYATPRTPYTPISVAPTSPPTAYQPMPSRPSTSYIPGSLPPTNLRNVSLGYNLPASMLVAASKYDSPYAPRPTSTVFLDARTSMSLLPSGSSGLTPYSGIPLLPLVGSVSTLEEISLNVN
jgi:hypothetical protein